MIHYSEGELRLMVRQERAQLIAEEKKLATERVRIADRQREITHRLEELGKADNILEGGL